MRCPALAKEPVAVNGAGEQRAILPWIRNPWSVANAQLLAPCPRAYKAALVKLKGSEKEKSDCECMFIISTKLLLRDYYNSCTGTERYNIQSI